MTTGAAINDFDGTPTTAISQTATVANGNVVGGNTAWDNSTDKWPMALATLQVLDGLSGAPTTGVAINLYMVRGEIESTVDTTGLHSYGVLTNASGVTDTNGMEFVGYYLLDTTSGALKRQITIPTVGIREAKFYIKNNTGVSLTYSSNAITVKIEGITLAPTA